MNIIKITKEYEEEIVKQDYTAVRIRNIVVGTLSEEEQKGGAKVLQENSDKLFVIAKKLTERDIKKFYKECGIESKEEV